MKSIKIFITTLILFLISVNIYADDFRIGDVYYNIQGNKIFRFTTTREYALKRQVEIDTKRIFHSFDEFINYKESIEQQLKNQRVLEESNVEYSLGETDENQVTKINLMIKTKDTWNIFPLPKPGYDSNDGFTMKLKLKDYNFFGSMKVFNFDINYRYAQFPNENKPNEHQLGMNFDFEIPFKAGIFDANWINEGSVSWALGRAIPDFNLTTALNFSYPFKIGSLDWGISQGLTYNDDYLATNDEFYFTEIFNLSVPLKVYQIKNWSDVVLEPYMEFTWNWDKDIFNQNDFTDSILEEDLYGPRFEAGLKAEVGRLDWINNHRKGILSSLSIYQQYNFHTGLGSPGSAVDLKAYYTFNNFLGINSRFRGFVNLNEDVEVGARLRGVIDNSYDTKSALSLSLDLPVTLFRTDWEKWGWTKHKALRFFKYLDFELQLSPFFDMLISNCEENDTIMSFKDGWYTSGIEMIFFPEKMRSLQIRISFGYDLTTVMPAKIINNNWRQKRSKYEIFFGAGLFY